MIERVEMDDGTVQVRFRLPAVAVPAIKACVVGEFNDWTPAVHPMVRDDQGLLVQIPLASGRSYRFRYLLDDERWENEPDADRYEPNGYGGEDSVVDLS